MDYLDQKLLNRLVGIMYQEKDGFDIKDIESFHYLFRGYDVILNAIANTDTYSKRDLHWDINYKFVHELILFCNKNDIKLVHISTDYLYSGSVSNASESDVPVHCNNWYGYTKLLADGLVQLESNNYLICRCTHKPTHSHMNLLGLTKLVISIISILFHR
jgi:dTDP-4-dehydrorhamnose reductase